MKIYCVNAYPKCGSVESSPCVERIFKDEKDAEACLMEVNKIAGWPRATSVSEEELE